MFIGRFWQTWITKTNWSLCKTVYDQAFGSWGSITTMWKLSVWFELKTWWTPVSNLVQWGGYYALETLEKWPGYSALWNKWSQRRTKAGTSVGNCQAVKETIWASWRSTFSPPFSTLYCIFAVFSWPGLLGHKTKCSALTWLQEEIWETPNDH